MNNWTEMHTALCVARTGTVSQAAEELGVHRATVNRHIDALEAKLSTKLFLRHRRGYELTDKGREFLSVAGHADELLKDFVGRMQVQSAALTGEVVVTTLMPLTVLIMPAILRFREQHPRMRVTLHTNESLSRLERAEAHVALRAGARPQHEDYVVQPFGTLDLALYAARSYLDRMGSPKGNDFSGHHFIGHPNPESAAPYQAWLSRHVTAEQVVLQTSNTMVAEDAMRRGMGIGFMVAKVAEAIPDLVQITPPIPECQVPTWLVTHVDLHRTDKVQSMLTCLKAIAP